MSELAEVVLDYYWFVSFCDDETLDPHTAVKIIEDLSYRMEHDFSGEEKQLLMTAAANRLASWLSEPDEYGYTPRSLLKPEQRQFLEGITAGQFSGQPDDDDE